nr:putative nuclease HARBI1 [Aegilops tauschii subsp. strangulata]
MAYGVPADYIDDNLAMAESTSIFYVKQFAITMVEVFGPQYLRAPNAQDTQRLLEMNEARGFPGMLGSVDCMHSKWKNCPKAWHGQFKGRGKDATIILEAVADYEIWIWHAYFGMPGSCNDINVLDRSPLFANLANGEAPPMTFEANGRTYNYGYYLADGIYPRWSTFVKPVATPQGKKELVFHNAQAAARKDVERAFGILQSQFAIVRGPARFWDQKILWYIMTACVIMHNMIIENERGKDLDYNFYHLMGIPVNSMRKEQRIRRFMKVYSEIRDSDVHDQLQKDLMEEHWKCGWTSAEQQPRGCWPVLDHEFGPSIGVALLDHEFGPSVGVGLFSEL